MVLRQLGAMAIAPVEGGPGRPTVPLDEQLLTTLMFLRSQQKIRDIADTFGRTDSCSFKSRKNITKLPTQSLTHQVIKWPEHAQYLNMSTVFNTNGFEGIGGCIDGTHINIPAPAVDDASYFNRKQTHSLLLQAVCDADMSFTHVLAGWPGRVHDSRVLKNSDIWNPIGPSIPAGYHLLGDGAYPLKTWLLTSYRDNGHLSCVQLCLNNKLSAKRQVIERAFGHLKGRFPRLKFYRCKNIHYNVYTIISVLHIMLVGDEDISEFFDDDDGKGGSTPIDHQPTHTTDDAAQRKLAAIAKNIFQP